MKEAQLIELRDNWRDIAKRRAMRADTLSGSFYALEQACSIAIENCANDLDVLILAFQKLER